MEISPTADDVLGYSINGLVCSIRGNKVFVVYKVFCLFMYCVGNQDFDNIELL